MVLSRPNGVNSQTLSRGIAALELLAEGPGPLTIDEVAARLGLARSTAYRIIRTLENHRLVVRDARGALELGPGLAALARNVSRDLQAAALPELTLLANDLAVTALVAVLDRDSHDAVTLASVEPRGTATSVRQRPGSRYPVGVGAPGRAIQRQLNGPAEPGYDASDGEITPGLSSIAIPLRVPGHDPAALAVIYLTRPVDVALVVDKLNDAAERIVQQFG